MPKRLWTPERLDKLRNLLREKISTKEIAEYFGVDESAIRQVMYREGIKRSNLGQHRSKLEKKHREKKDEKKDLATRIRILKGEELRKEEPQFGFSDEQLSRWLNGKNGCNLFCREVLGVELQDYQLEMVEKMINHKRCCFVMGRQSGKDFTIACFVIWNSICNSNQRMLLVSPAQRQSDLLFDRILQFIGLSNELFTSVEKSNMEVCRFTNKSEVHSLPSTTYIRGFTEVTHIFVNEVAHGISGDTFAAIEPMLAIKHGSLILMSSPLGCQGKLWEAFNSPIYAKMRLPSTTNKYISREWIETQEKTMPVVVYDCEVNANFSQAIDNFFPMEVIDKCSQEYGFRSFPEPELDYYLGVDWGRVRDSSVLTIISKNSEDILKVEKIIEFQNKPFSAQVEHIRKLHNTFGFRKIVAEYAGLGIMPCEKLKEMELPVEFFKPTLDNKEGAYNHLLRTMEDGNLIIPKGHYKLQHELRLFQYEVTGQGKTKLHHVLGGSDDFCDSLCLAVNESKKSGFVFDFIELPVRSIY